MSEPDFQGYSDRFTRALQKAHQLHSGQVRKGINVPYIAHLLAVTALVIESGGEEDEAIAALLHDGPEDAGGRETLKKIRRDFGDPVADIVEHCTDTFEDPKPEWWARKREYHKKLGSASPSALLVSVADKVHNAESTANDLQNSGPEVWSRFRMGREGSLWNYSSLVEIYREKRGSIPSPLVDRLEQALDNLFEDEAEKVMARFFEPSSEAAQGRPELRIVSGAVCTGKSRFIREQFNSGYVHIDAPRVFLAMCRGEILDFPGNLEEKLEAIGQSVAHRAIEEQRNIVVELIGQDRHPLELMVQQLRACGYDVKNDVVDCDVDVALERNEQRGENDISAYYAEPYHCRWLSEAAGDCQPQ